MEHYEIEDLFFKRKRPQLKIQLESNNLVRQPVFDIIVLNEGKVLAEKGLLNIKIPEEFEISGEEWDKISQNSGLKKYQYYNLSRIPFYPGVKTNIGRIYLPKEKRVLEEFQFVFMITCENMEII